MSFCSSAPIVPAVANLQFVTGQMPQDLAKDVEMLPRTTQVATQVGQSVLVPFGQNISHYAGRMVILPQVSVQEKRDHDQKKRDLVRGVIVTKSESSNDTPDKPKD